MAIIVHVLVTAFLLFVLAQLIEGFEVRSGKAAIFGAIMLGLANAFVRPILVVLTLPVTILTLGLFLLVVDGFEIEGFGPALMGSVGLAVLNYLVGVVL
jgi:putative membrane protein